MDQKLEQTWETPTHEEIRQLSKTHVKAMETLDLDEVWIQAGMQHVLLRTTGRRTGTEHKVALPVWFDPRGHRIVVASFAGAKTDPAWFLNLLDREANAEVSCKSQQGEFISAPEILDGDDYATTWALLNEDRAWYNDYQAITDRRIPLVRLPETRIP